MAKKILQQQYFFGGISESEKTGLKGSFNFAQNLNIFSEPTNLTLNPKSAKDSGETVIDLVKWITSGSPYNTSVYFYGSAGNIYRRTSAGSWSVLQTTSNSYGQGMELYDDYLYYMQNTQIGRYGPLEAGSPTFDDDWQTSLNDTSASGKQIAPIKAFMGGMAVGHGNYLGWWDGSVWDADELIFPPGFNVRSLEVIDEYLVISAWKGSSIQNCERNIIFFWDGSATTYNFFIETPTSGLGAILNSKNRLLSFDSLDGFIYINYTPFQRLDKIPKLEASKYVEVYPSAVTNWRGQSLIGIAANTDSTSLIQGIYQWGSKSDKYPEALNMGYTPSHGKTQVITLHIGSVKGIGDTLFVGWQDDTTYGVDKIVVTAGPFPTGSYEGLLFDDNRPVQDKLALTLKATHKALATGESVQLGYKTNRASSYTTGTANSTVGSTETRLPILASMARFKDFQYEILLATSVATSPTITAIGLSYDDLTEEQLV